MYLVNMYGHTTYRHYQHANYRHDLKNATSIYRAGHSVEHNAQRAQSSRDGQLRLDLRRTAPASRPTTHLSRPLRQIGSSGEPEAKTLGSRLWHEQRTQSGQRVSNEMRARSEAMRARERG